MRFQDYPPQEPSLPQAASYRDACIAGSFGVPFAEFSFGPDLHQSVAIYSPAKSTGALFAFIHGGGWTNGYKETMGFMAPALTAQGITFASIGHRLAPAHIYPVGLEDCADAVVEIHRRARAFGCDPDRIFLGGHSSGGHYASLLAVRRDWQGPRGLPRDVVKGCLPISGVYRFGEGSGLSNRPRFLGPPDSGLDVAASSILQIQGSPPSFVMAYGDEDFPHLRRQAVEMAAALRAAGGSVTSIVLPQCNHFTASLAGGEAEGPWVAAAVAFIKSYGAI